MRLRSFKATFLTVLLGDKESLPLSHIWKISKQSAAQTGNNVYLLSTLTVVFPSFACWSKSQTLCKHLAVTAPGGSCASLWNSSVVGSGVELQPQKSQLWSSSRETHLSQEKGSLGSCPPLPTAPSFPVLASRLALKLATGEWQSIYFLLEYWVGKNMVLLVLVILLNSWVCVICGHKLIYFRGGRIR